MAVVGSSPVISYEEARKQRMEENKRRMEELGLMDLSKNLKELKKKDPSKKPAKRKSHEVLETRRSSRVAAKPAVSYKDQLNLLPGMRERYGTRERQGLVRRYLSDAARVAAVDAAEEVYKDIKNPAFVKPMLHSHTSSCFWLGLPVNFCKEHMPLQDERFMLEDDERKEWECLYLAHKIGMSGGWRGFSLDHDLVDGDCCIFELVRPNRFKVHIFRCEEDESDGMEAAVNVETKKEKKAGKAMAKKTSKARKGSKSSSKELEIDDEEEDEDDDESEDEDEDEIEYDDEDDDDEDDDDDDDDGGGDDDDEDDYSPKLSEREFDTIVAGPSRVSRHKRANEEDDDSSGGYAAAKFSKREGKEPDEVIELESGKDEDEDDDKESDAVANTNQGGSGDLSAGRVTRRSSARFLSPSSTT